MLVEVRVRMIRGPEQLLNKLTELHVRSWVIKRMAYIYIERHFQDLAKRKKDAMLCLCLCRPCPHANTKQGSPTPLLHCLVFRLLPASSLEHILLLESEKEGYND